MSNLSATTGNDLVPVLSQLAPSPYASDEDFSKISSSGAFLPRVMLMGANSTLVQEGKINQGHYGLVRAKDQCDDLTKEVPCLPLDWRAKAMEIVDGEVISIYDRKSPEFDRIAQKSEQPDSGCMYGPEFLLWIPSAKCFATYYASSKTARREAPQLRNLIGKPALLKSHLIKGKKYNWFGPVITTCSVPFDLPSQDEIIEEVTKFRNPAPTEKEAAPEGATDRAR
jgi:hypothetical protein